MALNKVVQNTVRCFNSTTTAPSISASDKKVQTVWQQLCAFFSWIAAKFTLPSKRVSAALPPAASRVQVATTPLASAKSRTATGSLPPQVNLWLDTQSDEQKAALTNPQVAKEAWAKKVWWTYLAEGDKTYISGRFPTDESNTPYYTLYEKYTKSLEKPRPTMAAGRDNDAKACNSSGRSRYN